MERIGSEVGMEDLKILAVPARKLLVGEYKPGDSTARPVLSFDLKFFKNPGILELLSGLYAPGFIRDRISAQDRDEEIGSHHNWKLRDGITGMGNIQFSGNR